MFLSLPDFQPARHAPKLAGPVHEVGDEDGVLHRAGGQSPESSLRSEVKSSGGRAARSIRSPALGHPFINGLLGNRVAPSTITKILKAHGIKPAADRLVKRLERALT